MKYKNFFLLFLVSSFLFYFLSPSCVAQEDFTIKDYLEQALPPEEGRKIALNETLGILTVTDTPSNHRLIKKLIKAWDVSPAQILIEARIVEITETDLGELGIEWMGKRNRAGSYIGPAIASDYQSSINVYNPAVTPTPVSYDHAYPYWSGTELGAPAEAAGLGLWIGKTQATGSQLYMYLRALEGKGKANLLSAPKVITVSGQSANIELSENLIYAVGVERTGGTYSYDEETNVTTFEPMIETYDIEEAKEGIFLEVTPVVTKGSRIINLRLHPMVKNLVKRVAIDETMYDGTVGINRNPGANYGKYLYETLGWPIFDIRETQTSINIESGKTIIVGGLIKDNEKVINRKVPILGDIPLLGNLFKYTHTERTKTNLVIFLTATLVTPEGEEVK